MGEDIRKPRLLLITFEIRDPARLASVVADLKRRKFMPVHSTAFVIESGDPDSEIAEISRYTKLHAADSIFVADITYSKVYPFQPESDIFRSIASWRELHHYGVH